MKKKTLPYLLVSCCLLASALYSQDDLLNELEAETIDASTAFNTPAFKAMKIGNLQSTKVAEKEDLFLYVSHRFGSLSNGISTFFGLDDANTKIQLVYGLLDGIQIGLSRESLRRTYAGSIKLKILEQKSDLPFIISAYSTVNQRTDINKSRFPKLKAADKLSFASQLLIAYKFSNAFSFELAPTYVRQNLVLEPFQKHDQIALGGGGRIKLSKRASLNFEYVKNFSRAEQSVFNDPFAVGIDIETGGHVFQLLFSNAQSTNEPGFISNAEGSLDNSNIFFGFNIVRVF